MGNYRALLFYNFFTIFILTLCFSCKANDEDRKVYIVYMGALPKGIYSPNSHHLSVLESVLEGSSVSNFLIRSYNRSFNGFVAKLTEQESQKLASLEEVVSIFPRKIYHTQTTRSWDFMGFLQTAKRNPTVESDTIVGVIDTGISPKSESFSDKGFGPPPQKWKGSCKGGTNFTCNNKIIGARFYSSSGLNIISASDDEGHGTHTASTAAGNSVKDVSFYEIAKGTARGGVPSARIAAYKVCSPEGCFGDAILAAFDDAIADGVDVITISLGSTWTESFENDPIAIGSFHAMTKGILTVNSAGNDGPGLWSVTSLAPWLMTVAASSTDRQILDKVVLGNGMKFIGRSINGFTLNGTFPLVHGRSTSTNCSYEEARTCSLGCLDNALVKGKIVVCDFASRTATIEAYRAGALGCILPWDAEYPDVSLIEPLPAAPLVGQDFLAVFSYLNSTNNPHATILKSEAIEDATAPNVASFSSRGPNSITPDILKPDITAPGIEILAAYSPTAPLTPDIRDKRRVKYSIESGTSMSCPHVAGVAAYVKTFHPEWSPSAIKSAIMTTAFSMKNQNITNGEFAYGSGHINPTRALSPGLVYETSKGDYINYLCSIGYVGDTLRRISGDNSSCPKGSDRRSPPRDLNYPSLTAQVSTGEFKVQFHRRVKNVGFSNSTYKARVVQKPGLDIRVVPAILSFKLRNEEKSFSLIVKGSGLPKDSMASTSLVWSDGIHIVKSPIVLHNINETES